MYYRIRETHSISYLNDEAYINNELKSMGTYINSLGDQINNNDERLLRNIIYYKTLSDIGVKPHKNKITQKRDTPIMNTGRTSIRRPSILAQTTK